MTSEHDDERDVLAARVVGPDAHPTGRLRILQADGAGRLQAQWRGEFGTIWIDVPTIVVPALPPRAPPLTRGSL